MHDRLDACTALLKNEWMQGQQTDEQTKKGKNEHMAAAEDYKS